MLFESNLDLRIIGYITFMYLFKNNDVFHIIAFLLQIEILLKKNKIYNLFKHGIEMNVLFRCKDLIITAIN